MFDRLALAGEADILEIGCGTGGLWLENRDRIPAGWRVVLSDLSAGMLRETRGRLREAGFMPRCCVADAQPLPFADASFDAVIANHMLYHVPNRAHALGEIQRVLRPRGVLLAATNGRAHLRELDDLIERYAPTTERDDAATRFGLENGAAQLQPWFAEVVREDYPDALAITEVEPVVAYVLSTSHASALDATQLAALRREIAVQIDCEGAFRVTKAAGLFRCRAVR
ncbi:MAG: class I SAM-dependent methyltransferase [Chloroflexota bacterium]|nr:class I SAM-dependent methyltransferase [Chloroflexota bacterium]